MRTGVLMEHSLPGALGAMRGDEEPAVGERIVSPVGDVVEDLVGHNGEVLKKGLKASRAERESLLFNRNGVNLADGENEVMWLGSATSTRRPTQSPICDLQRGDLCQPTALRTGRDETLGGCPRWSLTN